jgi:hypothetical protein
VRCDSVRAPPESAGSHKLHYLTSPSILIALSPLASKLGGRTSPGVSLRAAAARKVYASSEIMAANLPWTEINRMIGAGFDTYLAS